MPSKPAHRPAIYLEPVRIITVNMPKSIIDWLDEKAAMTKHHSRSRTIVDLLDELRMDELRDQAQYRP